MFFFRSGNRNKKITKYNLRNCVNCVYSAPKKEHFRKFCSFIAPVIYNKLPDKIKIITSGRKFLSKAKDWLFNVDNIESLFVVLS